MQSIIAQLQCEVTYIPFQHTDADPTAGADAGSNEAGTDAPKMGGTFSSITDQDKGILTVTLTGCRNLEVYPPPPRSGPHGYRSTPEQLEATRFANIPVTPPSPFSPWGEEHQHQGLLCLAVCI